MFKTLSKSAFYMFIFDFIVLLASTIFWTKCFGYTYKADIILSVLVVSIGLVVLYLKGNYKIREFNINLKNTYLLFEGIVMVHVIPTAYLLIFAKSISTTINFIVANILTIFIILRIYRAIYHIYLFRIKKEKNILILGTDERAKIIADEILSKKALRMKVVGFVKWANYKEDFLTDTNVPVYDNINDLKPLIKELKIDIVVIAQPTDLILTLPFNIDIYKMPDFYEFITGKYYIDDKTMTELYYQFIKGHSYIYDICKRIYDIVAALIILIVTFPILFYIGIRVKLTDGGSPVYTQDRVGKNGKIFKCYKLRTMYKNDYVPKDVHNGGYASSQETDDRVIPFCRFVRKARLDEIPQMLNILKGDISIVGPRAEWDNLVKIYSKEIPFYAGRQWVKTGWTGWAQINQGHCINNDDVQEKLQYDLFYLKHRNILWEIFILVKAVFLALGGRHD